MLFLLQFSLAFVFRALLVAGSPLVQRNDSSTNFVSVQDGAFQLDGKFFRFYGTNAYWAHMTTEYDLDMTFHDIATAGLKVVRTWAFNDVTSKPSSGPYFQILSGGKSTINEGADGLQRLDKLVAAADKYGIKLILTLTNNWNPERPLNSVAWNRREVPDGLSRGYLPNDYGGIDVYVRNYKPGGTHDLFYTHRVIIDAFKYYVKAVVSRYSSHPAILAWELGNDLRCSSTVPASSNCNPKTITKWAAEISGYIKELDHKHLVTVGDNGFYCIECPKLFANTSTSKRPSLAGPSFDGSFGIDTEDLISIPSVDFGSFQISSEELQLFPVLQGVDTSIQTIGDGGRWIGVHSQTSNLLQKPVALLSAGIVTRANCKFFVANDQIAPNPDNSPCRGVEEIEATYALSSWASASLNGNVGGVLEPNWIQAGITSTGTSNGIWDKRQLGRTSPQNGLGRYDGAASGLNARQFASGAPPV